MSKPPAPAPRRLRRSVVWFAVIFALLILPWPGFDELYGSYFRALGTLALSREDSPRLITFDRVIVRHDFSVLNTQMQLGNRELADAGGMGNVLQLALDTRSIGWVPTALTLALILATPIPWRRKLGALVAGLILVHLLILFTLETWIWSESTSLSLTHLGPFAQEVADGLSYTLLNQLGISFTAPVVIWLLVCFRKRDALLWLGRDR